MVVVKLIMHSGRLRSFRKVQIALLSAVLPRRRCLLDSMLENSGRWFELGYVILENKRRCFSCSSLVVATSSCGCKCLVCLVSSFMFSVGQMAGKIPFLPCEPMYLCPSEYYDTQVHEKKFVVHFPCGVLVLFTVRHFVAHSNPGTQVI